MRARVAVVCFASMVLACSSAVPKPPDPVFDLAVASDATIIAPDDLRTTGLDALPDLTSPTCSDATKNGSESDVDCGGTCAPCADGRTCVAGTDCASRVCAGGTCRPPSCTDGLKNGDETDPDCGGATGCPRCADEARCAIGGDCASGVCTAGFCTAATCSDGVRNGGESDVDCGGTCSPCADGRACAVAGDCMSNVCNGSVCRAAACDDGVRNGSETDVDCGGTCGPCADGRNCSVAGDCASGVCTGNACAAAACNDGVRNGGETDVDCGGGGTCPRCGDDKGCAGATDCTSGVCTAGTCRAPTCSDGARNGGETDVDCGGGTCPRCGDDRACGAASDCASRVCTGGTCRAATCSDGVQNGGETDVDCGGGGTCPRCGVGTVCTAGTDCASNVCTAGACVYCVAAGATVPAAYYTSGSLGRSRLRSAFNTPVAYTHYLFHHEHPSDYYDLTEINLLDAGGSSLTNGMLGTGFTAQSRGNIQNPGIQYYIGGGSTIAWMFDGNTTTFYDDQYSTWHEVLITFSTPRVVRAVDVSVVNQLNSTTLSLYGSNDGVRFYPIPAVTDSGNVNVSSIQSFSIPWGNTARTNWLIAAGMGTCP